MKILRPHKPRFEGKKPERPWAPSVPLEGSKDRTDRHVDHQRSAKAERTLRLL